MLLLDVKNIVGESIVWSQAEAALYWVDIVGRAIHRLRPTEGTHTVWEAHDFPTSIGLRAGGGFIVGLRREVRLWTPGGAFEPFAVPEPDLPDNRLNEGKVAPDGSFWVGSMQDNLEDDGTPKSMDRNSGAYYRVAADGRVEPLTDRDYGITNTMVWMADGRFVAADTLRNALYVFDFDAPSGTISGRRDFATGFERGLPDGSCLDSEGAVWTCRVAGGGCLTRHRSDGTLDKVVDLPCSSPTSCTFGGPNLETLYVTSSRFAMAPEALEMNQVEGGLFALDVGVTGLPEHQFAG